MPAALPDPWLDLGVLDPNEQKMLEASYGSKLTYDDLTDDEVNRDGPMIRPRGGRAMLVMGAQWRRIRNVDTDLEVLVRLQADDPMERVVRITSVIVPFDAGRDLTGVDLRTIPLAALSAAFSTSNERDTAHVAISFALHEDDRGNPLEPLPAASAQDSFTARVALQYWALLEQEVSKIPKRMAEINGKPLSTVQRWIARARKLGMIPQHDPKRR